MNWIRSFCVFDIFLVRKTQHKRKNLTFSKKNENIFQNFIIHTFKKLGMRRPAPSVCKWNKIINFVLSVKLRVKMHFLQDHPEACIFYLNRFIFILPKKSRNIHLLAIHDYYFFIKTFLSQVNNKEIFWVIHPLKLLDRAVSGALFLTGNVFECDIAYCRSVAVLCMLYKIRCYPMHPLNGALPSWTVRASAGYTQCPCRTSVY